MLTNIYYFSGTGNSLVVATILRNNLPNSILLPIASFNDKPEESEADAIGFVFPVYCGGPPVIVKEFIEHVIIKNPNAYIFTLTTATSQVGATYNIVKDVLYKKGHTLASGFNINMPGNYTVFYGASSKEKQMEFFEKAQTKIDNAIEIIKTKQTTKMPGSFLGKLFFTLMYKFSSRNFHKMDKWFFADEECNSCGTCAKVCPVENIKMVDGKPVWKHKCTQCFACLQWCPQDAIQAGKITKGRKRYHHPDITAHDIMAQKNK